MVCYSYIDGIYKYNRNVCIIVMSMKNSASMIQFLFSAVWCYIRVVNVNGTEDYQATLIAQLIGYDIWVYATFFILPAIYFTLMCYLRYRVSHNYIYYNVISYASMYYFNK